MTAAELDQQAYLASRQVAIFEELLRRYGTPAGAKETQLRGRGYGTTAGWEPLTVDCQSPPTPDNSEVWIVTRVTIAGEMSTNPPNAFTPITGLFLVPVNTAFESLADASNAARGWNPATRGIPLPAGVVTNVTPLPSGLYAYSIALTQNSPIFVNAGETIRAVISCNPGTAQPGPGAASWGELTVMGTRRPL